MTPWPLTIFLAFAYFIPAIGNLVYVGFQLHSDIKTDLKYKSEGYDPETTIGSVLMMLLLVVLPFLNAIWFYAAVLDKQWAWLWDKASAFFSITIIPKGKK